MTDEPRDADQSQHLSRREAVARIAGSIGVLSLSGVLAAAAGCASTGSARSRIGDPIPEDPTVAPVGDAPSRPRSAPVVSSELDDVIPRGVIPRSAWASFGPNTQLAVPMGSVAMITVHHDGMSPFTARGQADAATRLENIRRGHVGMRWADIGYHYAIDPAGRVWQGRPVSLQGAHVKHHNPGNLGILVMGNYERQRPTDASLRALDGFIVQQMRTHRLGIGSVYTHQEFAPTACPGRNLQAYMNMTRSRGGTLARA